MRTAQVKAIALPAVYRANLEFQSHVPFHQSHVPFHHSRTRSRICARADAEGFSAFIFLVSSPILVRHCRTPEQCCYKPF